MPTERRVPALAALVTASVTGIAFVVLAVLVCAGATAPVDEALHAWAAGLRHPAAVGTADGLAVAGGTWGVVVTAASLTLVLALTRHGAAAIALPLATVLGWLAMEAVKQLLERARPLERIDDIGGWAFPSGHSTCAAAIAVVLLLAVRTLWVRALAVVWLVAMPASRVLLGVHWASDTLGGMLLGVTVALVVWAVALAVAQSRASRATEGGTAMPSRRSGAGSGAP